MLLSDGSRFLKCLGDDIPTTTITYM